MRRCKRCSNAMQELKKLGYEEQRVRCRYCLEENKSSALSGVVKGLRRITR